MKAFAKLGAATLAYAAACAGAAAGDAANLNVLGFDGNGDVFAFEEYGIQDGSGFPYANRFYIDTNTDKFLPGTPIRVRLEQDGASVDAARADAKAKGEAIVPRNVLDANRGYLAGFNALTETSADPHRMTVSPRPVFPPIDPPLALMLDELPFEDAQRCMDLGDLKGFRLRRLTEPDGGTATILHEDTAVPASRNCATGYRLSGVQMSSPENPNAFAVLIAIESIGFEGPDFRWMAVAGRL